MNLVKFFNQFLVKDKKDVSLEEYIHTFNKKERYYGMNNSQEHFYPLLEALYNTDDELYNDYHKKFSKISYDVVKREIPFISKLVHEKVDPEIIVEVIEMMKRESAIVTRNVSKYRNPNPGRENYEKYFNELETVLELLKEQDNPLQKVCIEEFSKSYEVLDNKYLKECYDICLSRIGRDIDISLNAMYKTSKILYERFCKGSNYDDYVIAKVKKKEY